MTPEQRIAQMSDKELLALCIWREAQGEGITGMRSVAHSIANRVKRPRWWGKDWRSVILRSSLVHNHLVFQYSCFNHDDPNYTKFAGPNDAAWADALDIADRIISGRDIADPTSGATHYLTLSLYEDEKRRPAWANKLEKTAAIGGHVFFLEA